MPSRFVFPATYIMASRPLGVLYVGSTNNLPKRVNEHRQELFDGFSEQYGCKMLVRYEQQELMTEAIRRELAIRHRRRVWKLELIERENPDWGDLFLEIAFG